MEESGIVVGIRQREGISVGPRKENCRVYITKIPTREVGVWGTQESKTPTAIDFRVMIYFFGAGDAGVCAAKNNSREEHWARGGAHK
jgi:hypothetical protein